MDSLLGRLRDRDRSALLQLGIPISYGKRQPVIRQGEPSKHVVLLLSGFVKVVADSEYGREVLLAVRGAGDVLGQMAALERRPRSANVIACGPVIARLVSASRFVDFLDRNPDAATTLARTMSEQLHWANHRRVEFVTCPAPVRLGRVLLSLAQRHGIRTANGWDLRVPLSQSEIASLAGVALGTAEKALHTLQVQGVVRRHYRRIVVVDGDRLRQFSGLSRENPY